MKSSEEFRVSRYLFNRILSCIKEDLTRSKCNCVSNPISAEEKLCPSLRKVKQFILVDMYY
jgi:hypothetical protein